MGHFVYVGTSFPCVLENACETQEKQKEMELFKGQRIGILLVKKQVKGFEIIIWEERTQWSSFLVYTLG